MEHFYTLVLLFAPHTTLTYYSQGEHVGFAFFSFCGKALHKMICSLFFMPFCPS